MDSKFASLANTAPPKAAEDHDTPTFEKKLSRTLSNPDGMGVVDPDWVDPSQPKSLNRQLSRTTSTRDGVGGINEASPSCSAPSAPDQPKRGLSRTLSTRQGVGGIVEDEF
eukprot:GHVN01000645.1.p1 GENE.GHVN01000645.1~~GHVN01000645.1.p1  ORF type:complete len:111 (+),score=10.24 GHVN01000645.1:81-413(+)